MRNLNSCLAVLATLAALPAFATGERIVVSPGVPASEQLKQTLCISMDCVASKDDAEAVVAVRNVGNDVEVRVLAADGSVRLTHRAPTMGEGHLSATDLVTATSKVFQAIEQPQLAAEQRSHERAESDRARADAAEKAKPAKASKAKARALAQKLKKKPGKLLATR